MILIGPPLVFLNFPVRPGFLIFNPTRARPARKIKRSVRACQNPQKWETIFLLLLFLKLSYFLFEFRYGLLLF